MKLHLCALALCALFLVRSCPDQDSFSRSRPEFLGAWYLKDITGGVTGAGMDFSDTLVLLVRAKDSLYFIKNGKIDQAGTFEIVQKKSLTLHTVSDFVIYQEDRQAEPLEYRIDELDKQHLILGQDVFDGFQWHFENGVLGSGK